MKFRHCVVAVVLCVGLLVLARLLATDNAIGLPPGFHRETVIAGGIGNPVFLAALPNGDELIVAAKDGRLFLVRPDQHAATAKLLLQIDHVDSEGERGIHSMALDPQFRDNGHIYIYYADAQSGHNQIARFTLEADALAATSKVLIWRSPLPWRDDCCHYGGALAFGPDEKLYLATGEEFDGAQSQDLTRSGGKILRLNRDGSAPADNPFADGPGGNLDEIWATGLRNPFRAYWDLPTNRYFVGEVGGNVQTTAREDLHLGRAGANYGWPYCEGNCGVAAWDAPIYSYPHVGATPAGGAIVAGFVYRGTRFPEQYRGRFFFADYATGWIRYLEFHDDGSVDQAREFATNLGPLVHLVESADGALWYADYSGNVGRITYESGPGKPIIENATASATQGKPPLSVRFDGKASTPGDGELHYHWLFGDGNTADQSSVTHTYTRRGVYAARLSANHGGQRALSDPIEIVVGEPPAVSIAEPDPARRFRAGDRIRFSGDAVSAGPALPDNAYRWEIEFLHNGHTHPVLSGHVGRAGEFTINRTGHDYHDDTGYRITLEVTDGDGVKGSRSVTLRPQKVDLRLSTTPVRIPLNLDGVQIATPIRYDTLVGFEHVVSAASPTCVGDTAYRFSHWSDDGAQTHRVVLPADDLELTAHFVAAGSCNALPTDGLVARFESDRDVVLNGDQVRQWQSDAASTFTLTARGDPQVIGNALGGLPAIQLDGADDLLIAEQLPTSLPTGSADREIFVVVRYLGVGYGGISYGAPEPNRSFGLLLTPGGKLMIQGWGYQNDFTSEINGNGTGWMIGAVALESGEMAHFKDGSPIGQAKHLFDTASERFVIGAELDESSHINMQIAAVLVYDRALDPNQRDAVYRYLNSRYFSDRVLRSSVDTLDENAAKLDVKTRLLAFIDRYQRLRYQYANLSYLERQRCIYKAIFSDQSCEVSEQ